MLVKRLGRAGGGVRVAGGLAALAMRRTIHAPGHRLHQLPCILVIAAIQHGGAAAGEVVGLVGGEGVVDDFDATRRLLTGERRGLKFRLGDEVRVQVLRASLEDRKIDFRLVAERS